MNKSDSNYIQRWAKKIKAINLKGGECEVCGEKNKFVLEFHHLNPHEKDYTFNSIRAVRWSVWKKELEKCLLLCCNCHAGKHSIENNRNGKFKTFIMEKCNNKIKCSICNKAFNNLRSVSFHHSKNSPKLFNIGDALTRKNKYSIDEIINEIDKCEIICRNCHQNVHVDKNKFFIFEKEIYDKSKNLKESKKVDKKLIADFIDKKIGICEASKLLGLHKSTVFYAYKRVKKERCDNGYSV